MSWNPLNLFKSIDKSIDVISEAVEDKDLANRLRTDIAKLKEEVYLAELNTRTIPWVDALHKMQRGILSVLSMVVSVLLVYLGVDDPLSLAAAVGPAGAYNIVKGRGR